MSSKELDHQLWEEVDLIVTNHVHARATQVFEEIQQIMRGEKHVNKDHKRVLCAEMNEWTDFLSKGEGNYTYYFVNELGDITPMTPDSL